MKLTKSLLIILITFSICIFVVACHQQQQGFKKKQDDPYMLPKIVKGLDGKWRHLTDDQKSQSNLTIFTKRHGLIILDGDQKESSQDYYTLITRNNQVKGGPVSDFKKHKYVFQQDIPKKDKSTKEKNGGFITITIIDRDNIRVQLSASPGLVGLSDDIHFVRVNK